MLILSVVGEAFLWAYVTMIAKKIYVQSHLINLVLQKVLQS